MSADRWSRHRAGRPFGIDEVFPPSAGHLRWQAELEAMARERERELRAILRRVALRVQTREDVDRLAAELRIQTNPTIQTIRAIQTPLSSQSIRETSE